MNNNINISELAYDLGILAFSFIISHYYKAIMAFMIGSVPFPVMFFMTALYVLPVLIGKIYYSNFSDSDIKLRKFVIFTMITNTAFIFIYTLYYIMKKTQFSEGMMGTLGVLTIVILIMAPIAGMVFTDKRMETEELSTQLIISVFTVGMFPLFIVLVNGSELFGELNGFLEFLIIAGFVLGDIFLIIMLMIGLIVIKRLAKNIMFITAS